MGRRDQLIEKQRKLEKIASTSDSEAEAVRAFIKARRLARLLAAGVTDEDLGGVVRSETIDRTRAFSKADGSAESFQSRVLRERQAVPMALPAPAEVCAGGPDAFDDTVPREVVDEVTAQETPKAKSGTLYGYNFRTEWD